MLYLCVRTGISTTTTSHLSLTAACSDYQMLIYSTHTYRHTPLHKAGLLPHALLSTRAFTSNREEEGWKPPQSEESEMLCAANENKCSFRRATCSTHIFKVEPFIVSLCCTHSLYILFPETTLKL